MPGIRLSMTSRSNGRSPSCRCASRALDASTTSWPSSRSARPSRFRIFSSSSASRIEPRMCIMAAVASGVPETRRAAADRCGCRCRAPCRLVDADGAAEAFDDVLGDRQAEAGARAPRREIGIEDVRHIVGADTGAAILHR